MKYIFLLLTFLSLRGSSAQELSGGTPPASPFDVKELNASAFNESQLGYVFIRDSNLICYQDTLHNTDTVRIAYKNINGQWITFPTPFARQFLRSDFYFADLDHDGQRELIVNGDASFESWPRGNATNYATVVFKLYPAPKIVFQCTNGCWVSNLTGRYQDSPLDFGIGRLITTDTTGLHVGELNLSQLTAPKEKNAFKEFCRLSAITPGTYKFENGKFVRVEKDK